MGRPELGTKCTCTACHERFYDLNRLPAVCPKCGGEQPPVKPRELRPPRSTFGTRMQSRHVPAAAAIDDDAEAAADTSDADAEEDADEAVDEADDDDEIDVDPGKPAD